jgi:hypothetical protein
MVLVIDAMIPLFVYNSHFTIPLDAINKDVKQDTSFAFEQLAESI